MFSLGRACTMKQVPRWLNLGLRSFRTGCQTRKLVEVSTESMGKFNIANIILNRPPVNSFNNSLASELAKALKEVEDSGCADAVIIRSSAPTTFSAGLDLNDLYQVSEDQLRRFWKNFQDMWFQLYTSRLTTVSAINGHCLAAGTIIAAASDYRIAVEGEYGIGVTAAKIGLVAPRWFLKMLTYLMGQRQTELYLQHGRVFVPEEAQSVGLVDQVCAPANFEMKLKEVLQQYLNTSHRARAEMKLFLRSDLVENFLKNRDKDLDWFVSFVLQDSVQSLLGSHIQHLKSKSS